MFLTTLKALWAVCAVDRTGALWVNFPGAEEQHKAFIPLKSHFNMQNRIDTVLKRYLQLTFFILFQYQLVYPALLFLTVNKDNSFNKKVRKWMPWLPQKQEPAVSVRYPK